MDSLLILFLQQSLRLSFPNPSNHRQSVSTSTFVISSPAHHECQAPQRSPSLLASSAHITAQSPQRTDRFLVSFWVLRLPFPFLSYPSLVDCALTASESHDASSLPHTAHWCHNICACRSRRTYVRVQILIHVVPKTVIDLLNVKKLISSDLGPLRQDQSSFVLPIRSPC